MVAAPVVSPTRPTSAPVRESAETYHNPFDAGRAVSTPVPLPLPAAIASSIAIGYSPRAMPDYSDYQKKIISRYYDNRDQQDEQKLAELVTNLYLAEGKKRAKLWEQARTYMERIKVPRSRIEHIMKSGDAAILAAVVQELLAGTLKRESPPPAQPPTATK